MIWGKFLDFLSREKTKLVYLKFCCSDFPWMIGLNDLIFYMSSVPLQWKTCLLINREDYWEILGISLSIFHFINFFFVFCHEIRKASNQKKKKKNANACSLTLAKKLERINNNFQYAWTSAWNFFYCVSNN